MSNAATPVDESHTEPAKPNNVMVQLLVAPLVILLLYLLAPFILAVLIRLRILTPLQAYEAITLIWAPLKWYVEAGLPGGQAYADLYDLIAGGL